MSAKRWSRRVFLKTNSLALSAMPLSITAAQEDRTPKIIIDSQPCFDLSPFLYMQFMEPLGTTDGSVSAAWDYLKNQWREDVIEASQNLAPSLIRWGGCLSSYYRWKEGVGPRDKRKPMINLLWGGMEPNQVGTHEFVDFCQRVGAEPLMSVNFESDGRQRWTKTPQGDIRWAGPEEAADWVDYCNNPSNSLRLEHGAKDPYQIGLWQIGNETSYDRQGFDLETAIRKTISFAKAMRRRDPEIQLIGWGDSGWAKPMIEAAGEHLQYIAFHHMFNPDSKPDPTLAYNEFRRDPEQTWRQLMSAHKIHEEKILRIREETSGYGIPLAMTECHFTIPGRNRCEVLSTWAAGVSYARMLNIHERHGDVLKIATAADFCGTRWQNNAVMIPVPQRSNKAFLMPVAQVMRLYRKHSGRQSVKVIDAPDDLDVTASRTKDRLFLHVVNTNRSRSSTASLVVDGIIPGTGSVYEIAIDPEFEVMEHNPEMLMPQPKVWPEIGVWTFPPASVSAVEIQIT